MKGLELVEGRDVGRRSSARVVVWPRQVELSLALELSIHLLSEPIFTLFHFFQRLQQAPTLTEEQQLLVLQAKKKEGMALMAKAMKVGGAADAAGSAARRSAAYAASQALGAKRRGKAAAEKAFTWMRGVKVKENKEVNEVNEMNEDEELKAVLALSLKEYEESQMEAQEAAQEAAQEDDLSGLLTFSSESDEDHSEEPELELTQHEARPPSGLRRLSLQVSLTKLTLELPSVKNFLLELNGLSASGDTLMPLSASEGKCLEGLGVPVAHVDSSAHSSNGSITVCTAVLRWGEEELLSVEPLPDVASWMMTLRLSVARLPRSTNFDFSLHACTHGLRLCPDLAALRDLEGCSKAFLPETTGSSSPPSLPSLDITLRHTVLDLGRLTPPCLKPKIVLPELRLMHGDPQTPPVPPWHVLPSPGNGPEPDLAIYEQAEVEPRLGWEELVIERRWEVGDATEQLLVPSEEILGFSLWKLKALEASQRWAELAERQHAESCLAIEKSAADRLPLVQQMQKPPDLEAMREELRRLDAQRREEELQLKALERDLAAEMAEMQRERLLREQDLQQQLEEEELITAALSQLLSQQAEAIEKFAAS